MLGDSNKRTKLIASVAMVSVAVLIIAGACIGLKSSGSSSDTSPKTVLPIPSSSNASQTNAPAVVDQSGNGDIENARNQTSAQTSSAESHHHHHKS